MYERPSGATWAKCAIRRNEVRSPPPRVRRLHPARQILEEGAPLAGVEVPDGAAEEHRQPPSTPSEAAKVGGEVADDPAEIATGIGRPTGFECRMGRRAGA
jgi:hypothetical protein